MGTHSQAAQPDPGHHRARHLDRRPRPERHHHRVGRAGLERGAAALAVDPDARLEGVVLRRMPAPGTKLKPARIEVLTTFFGGQGTINVNSWSPDSKRLAYVVYEPLPPR